MRGGPPPQFAGMPGGPGEFPNQPFQPNVPSGPGNQSCFNFDSQFLEIQAVLPCTSAEFALNQNKRSSHLAGKK